jgi:hypothetical protein
MSYATNSQSHIRDQQLYNSLYKKLKIGGPGIPDAGPAGPGTMAQQAEAAGGQDLYRNIQALREAKVRAEKADGGLVREFQGVLDTPSTRTQAGLMKNNYYNSLKRRVKGPSSNQLPQLPRLGGLAGYLGQAAEKTAPGIMLVLGAAIVYFLFFNKKKDVAEEPEAAEEVFVEEEIESAPSLFF